MNPSNIASQASIRERVIHIIESNFFSLAGDPSVNLISTGLLDSLKVMILVAKLEQAFDVRIEAHEIDAEKMDNVDKISMLIVSRLKNE